MRSQAVKGKHPVFLLRKEITRNIHQNGAALAMGNTCLRPWNHVTILENIRCPSAEPRNAKRRRTCSFTQLHFMLRSYCMLRQMLPRAKTWRRALSPTWSNDNLATQTLHRVIWSDRIVRCQEVRFVSAWGRGMGSSPTATNVRRIVGISGVF